MSLKRYLKSIFDYNKGSNSNHKNNSDIIKGYKIHVTPQLSTRLKVLKLRNKIFNSKEEAESKDFKLNEATILPVTKTFGELGIDIPDVPESEVATDIHPMKGEELERYYQFLEEFRTIIENNTLSIPERIKLVDSINDYREFSDLVNGKDAKKLLLKELSEINGITEPVANQLFDKGIYTKEAFFNMKKEHIKKLKGIGSSRLAKIMKEKEDYNKEEL
jgi:hypothetical protein